MIVKMNKQLEKLERFLKETPIPHVSKRPTTFLGISKQPHYENVWSNIYAFFLDLTGEHNLDDLFLQSLLQLINEANGSTFLFNPAFQIDTEYRTKKNGRIDILLSNSNDAIIIENKVYHHLNNDLSDYWGSVTQANKQGVILSLQKIIIYNQNFIGITHLEFLQRVLSNLPNYFSNANEKYIIFLKDFYQNVLNTTNPMDTNVIKFFCRNKEEINKVAAIRNDYVSYVISEVEKARINIDEVLQPNGSRNEKFRYYVCPEQSNLMITIIFENLFTEKQELLFIVELKNQLIRETEKIRSIPFNDAESNYIRSDFFNQTGFWAHFAIQSEKPNEEQLMNLGDYIAKTVNDSPILSIYRKLKKTLVDEL